MDLQVTTNLAVECSNVGAELLQLGFLHEAVETFKQAAEILYPVSEYFQTNALSVFGMPVTWASAPWLTRPDISATTTLGSHRRLSLDQAKAKLFELYASLPQAKFPRGIDNAYIYAEPFPLDYIKQSPKCCCLEAAVIVYNMGAAYLEHGSDSCLEKAAVLFDMAFSLAFGTGLTLDRATQVAMASLNNTAHIYHSFGNYDVSRQYLASLRSLILSLHDTPDMTSLQIRQNLLLNAMLLEEPRAASAA